MKPVLRNRKHATIANAGKFHYFQAQGKINWFELRPQPVQLVHQEGKRPAASLERLARALELTHER